MRPRSGARAFARDSKYLGKVGVPMEKPSLKGLPIKEKLARLCLYWFFRLLHLTYRFEFIGGERHEAGQHIHPKGSYILAGWHEHVISIVQTQRGRPMHALVSANREGQWIGYVCNRYGFGTISGSQDRGKNKGGVRAMLGLMHMLRDGGGLIVTVDGSIGPRRVPKHGVCDLSLRTSSPIVPFAAEAKSYWELPTWDRTQIPKPFTRIVVSYGQALLPKELSTETFVASLTQAIDGCEKEARIRLGKAVPSNEREP